MGPESTRSHDFDRLFGMPLYETCHGADRERLRAQVFAKNDMDAKLLDCCCVLHRWQEALLLQGAAAVAGLPIHVPTSPGPRRPYAPARVV